MKRLTYLITAVLLAGVLIYSGCTKDDEPASPVQTFKTSTGYISSDMAKAYGDTLLFGISAAGNGTDNLVKFQVSVNGLVLMDSTINTQNFSIDLVSVKSILDKEVWKFVTTDIAGNSDADSIIVTGDFGDINTYNSIVIGAQNNTADKGFLSFSNSTFTQYTQDEAFNFQSDIDIFCFYENVGTHVNLMTLASPGSGISGIFTGSTAPENYTVKNITFFVKTDLSAAAFDQVANDAMILANFDPNNKFKKAKLLTAGDVYAFKLSSGKYGLFKVVNVTGVEDGNIEIAVKIQK